DNSGETPPFSRHHKGQVAMVNLLLGRKDIIFNQLGTVGFSAIYLATWGGHEEILGILLAQQHADRNLGNWNGWGRSL
ncbi:hypothetical protein L873DRAFT_1701721, partial [Choiromyces venosus 120613-1]